MTSVKSASSGLYSSLTDRKLTEGCSLVICSVFTSVLRSCRRGLISLRHSSIVCSHRTSNCKPPLKASLMTRMSASLEYLGFCMASATHLCAEALGFKRTAPKAALPDKSRIAMAGTLCRCCIDALVVRNLDSMRWSCKALCDKSNSCSRGRPVDNRGNNSSNAASSKRQSRMVNLCKPLAISRQLLSVATAPGGCPAQGPKATSRKSNTRNVELRIEVNANRAEQRPKSRECSKAVMSFIR
mmetsp:Transcript_52487/g.97171  ORF Transcript_52487/g.97171 Transcript_52487/m.97171 type:complete len:242 (-) Transcript_52487:477-1202(-)